MPSNRDTTAATAAITTHGASGTPLYRVWHSMLQRCHYPGDHNYALYGGRGIKVCAEWREDPAVFLAWAEANGYAHGLEIDRIDNDGDYCPENCRWATAREQANNRRTNRHLTIRGETRTVAEWAREAGIHRQTLLNRINAGWHPEDAVARAPNRSENQRDRPRRALSPVQ